MKYYLAPMEGSTTYIFRSCFHKYFGGIDRYFTPFLSSRRLSDVQKAEILPENNPDLELIPQILTNRADEFVDIAKAVAEYGYNEVNLNLGCPSGTVAAKHRGAGFLAVPKELDEFLAEIYDKCPINISIKTRIGISEEWEWEDLLKIYEKYPMSELIIHTRLQKDFYKKPARPDAFALAADNERITAPLCYNGDIWSPEVLDELTARYPSLNRVMIGRWLLEDPNLIRRLRGEAPVPKEGIADFMDELLQDYSTKMSGGEKVTLYKMKEIWAFLGKSFTDSERYVKKIMKSKYIADYRIAVRELIQNS